MIKELKENRYTGTNYSVIDVIVNGEHYGYYDSKGLNRDNSLVVYCERDIRDAQLFYDGEYRGKSQNADSTIRYLKRFGKKDLDTITFIGYGNRRLTVGEDNISVEFKVIPASAELENEQNVEDTYNKRYKEIEYTIQGISLALRGALDYRATEEDYKSLIADVKALEQKALEIKAQYKTK